MPTEIEQRNLETLDAYFEATNRGDLDAMVALTTPDILFENTYPPPDGERLVGQAAFRTFFDNLLHANRSTRELPERIIPAGDFCTVQWRYDWVDSQGNPGHVRGVSIFRFENGKISEHINYVKG